MLFSIYRISTHTQYNSEHDNALACDTYAIAYCKRIMHYLFSPIFRIAWIPREISSLYYSGKCFIYSIFIQFVSNHSMHIAHTNFHPIQYCLALVSFSVSASLPKPRGNYSQNAFTILTSLFTICFLSFFLSRSLILNVIHLHAFNCYLRTRSKQ